MSMICGARCLCIEPASTRRFENEVARQDNDGIDRMNLHMEDFGIRASESHLGSNDGGDWTLSAPSRCCVAELERRQSQLEHIGHVS